MKGPDIQAAQLDFGSDGVIVSRDFGIELLPPLQALERAESVYLHGSDLPARWAGRDGFTVLETAFGLGFNFLATWRAWRENASVCGRLVYVSVEEHPPCRDDLLRAHAHLPSTSPLAAELAAAWPPLTRNVHVLDFEGGRVRLLLALGAAEQLVPELLLQADALFLDGIEPCIQPKQWSRRLVSALGRKAAHGATAASWNGSPELAAHARAAGFIVESKISPGQAQTRLAARFDPPFVPRKSPARLPVSLPKGGSRDALVIGAGLAGCAAARALALSGWSCQVLDRNEKPGSEASGNPAGLFHGTAHGVDGIHARFTRAAALFAAERYREAVSAGRIAGQVEGLLRLNPAELHADLSGGYMRPVSQDEASTLAQGSLPGAAWWYPSGGWVSPGDVCRDALATPGVRWQGNKAVARLNRCAGHWQALDSEGRLLAEAPVVVCATGVAPPPFDTRHELQLSAVRGQVSWLEAADVQAPPNYPARPLSGNGYALRLHSGRLLFGATSHVDDMDTEVRAMDHQTNLCRLQALCGVRATKNAQLAGRVGWRATHADRLPVVGAWPAPMETVAARLRQDQCRRVPREPGLFVLMGLASRGLTWAPLAAEVLAAWINGSPMPLEADLLDAIDPARERVRRNRRDGA